MVIIDILRATSCIVTAFIERTNSILAFDNLEDCYLMKDKGYLIAGERDGKKVDNFDLGNSPFDYVNGNVQGRNIAITTTNGTKALKSVSNAKRILIGSFLNSSAISDTLIQEKNDVLLYCSGWKGLPNTEDTLFAGMIISKLVKEGFKPADDASLLSLDYYRYNQNDILSVIKGSAHALRLSKITNITKDLEFCAKIDLTPLVPYLKGDVIIT